MAIITLCHPAGDQTDIYIMINAIRFTVAAFVLATLAACASQAQPDLTPPQKRGYDAKTQLETGRRG
jgi:hypothetical protein